VEYKVDNKWCDNINSNGERQFFDANGNSVSEAKPNQNSNQDECECLGVKVDSQIKSTTISESNSSHQIDENIMAKIQKMTLSDDDYGEFHC
jgi:hypothetical protein